MIKTSHLMLLVLAASLTACKVNTGKWEPEPTKTISLLGNYQGDPAYVRVNFEDDKGLIQTNVTNIGSTDLSSRGIVADDYYEHDKKGYMVLVKPGKTKLGIRCRPGVGVGSSRQAPWGGSVFVDQELKAGHLYKASGDEILGDYCHAIVDEKPFKP